MTPLSVVGVLVKTKECFLILAVGAILLSSTTVISAADAADATIHTYWSPHHRFSCHIQQGKASGESVVFTDSVSHKTETLLTTVRWAQVFWSPDDTWFCVDDEWDPDNNRLHVYHAYHDGTTGLIWSTFEAAPDTYWKVLGWRLDKGMIRIEANYAKDYNKPSKGWITQSYMIPISLPNQVTTEEAYLRAVRSQQK